MLNELIAIKNLSLISNILNKYKVSHWLQDGTLLGFYRDNKIISHDNDTDIGVKFDTFNPLVLKEFTNAGFKIKYTAGRPQDCLVIGLGKNKTMTDLYFYYDLPENKMYHSASASKSRFERIDYVYERFDTKQITWYGKTFPVPEDEEKFVITKYGADWQTPKPEWNHMLDPVNAVITGIVLSKNQANEDYNNWINKV